MAKPATSINWTYGNPDQAIISVEPGAAKKQEGWKTDERPPKEYMNWLFQNIDEWIKYLDSEVENFSTQSVIYDAYVGANGTHADINSLMADPDIASKKHILVIGTIAVDEIQVISRDGMTFEFKAGAGITKNGPTGAATGLQIQANRTRIINARFLSFNAAGNVALKIDATYKNNLVQGCMFNDNETAIDDQGTNNQLIGNIEEV